MFAGTRLDGVLTRKVRKDGANSTRRIAEMILASPSRGHVRAIPRRGVMVQRVGLDRDAAARFLATTTLHGALPEPLRVAHLIAGGLATGTSRGRA